jgi:hypothetical protein
MLITLVTAALTALVTSITSAAGTRIENLAATGIGQLVSGWFRAAGQTQALETLRTNPQAEEAQKTAQRVIAQAATSDTSFRTNLESELQKHHPAAWQHGQRISQQLESHPDLRDQLVAGQVAFSSALQFLVDSMRRDYGWTDAQTRLSANLSACPVGGEPFNVFSVRYLTSDGSLAKRQTSWIFTSERKPQLVPPEYPVCARCSQGHVWQVFIDKACTLVKRS